MELKGVQGAARAQGQAPGRAVNPLHGVERRFTPRRIFYATAYTAPGIHYMELKVYRLSRILAFSIGIHYMELKGTAAVYLKQIYYIAPGIHYMELKVST